MLRTISTRTWLSQTELRQTFCVLTQADTLTTTLTTKQCASIIICLYRFLLHFITYSSMNKELHKRAAKIANYALSSCFLCGEYHYITRSLNSASSSLSLTSWWQQHPADQAAEQSTAFRTSEFSPYINKIRTDKQGSALTDRQSNAKLNYYRR